MATNNRNDIDYNHYITTAEEQIEQSQEQSYNYLSFETETTSQATQTVQTDFNYETEEDDYSLKSNFTEQSNYEIKQQEVSSVREETSQTSYSPMNMPLIEQKVEQSLEQSKRIELSARMKVVLASFIVIVSSLMFATIWNFIAVAKINSTLLANQETVSSLKVSIKDLTEEYNLLGDEETIKDIAKGDNFVDSDDNNTVEISLENMFTEPEVPDVPSNWFNDVCNFLTTLFS